MGQPADPAAGEPSSHALPPKVVQMLRVPGCKCFHASADPPTVQPACGVHMCQSDGLLLSRAESASVGMQMAADGRSPGLPITSLVVRAAYVHLLWGLQRLKNTASPASQELSDLAGQAQALADQLERIFATADTLGQQDAVFQTQADLFLIFSPDKLPVRVHRGRFEASGLMVIADSCLLAQFVAATCVVGLLGASHFKGNSVQADMAYMWGTSSNLRLRMSAPARRMFPAPFCRLALPQ